jgi:hypothetical protein
MTRRFKKISQNHFSKTKHTFRQINPKKRLKPSIFRYSCRINMALSAPRFRNLLIVIKQTAFEGKRSDSDWQTVTVKFTSFINPSPHLFRLRVLPVETPWVSS